MRMKELFTIPKGKKISEKVFARVLVSSICSILLCTACLAGTTWAWFTVSIENRDNVIQIGTPEVTVTIGDGTAEGDREETGTSRWLAAGSYRMKLGHGNEADDLKQKSVLYVTLTVDGETSVYTVLDHENQYQKEIGVTAGKDCTVSWSVSWFAPANAEQLKGDSIIIGEVEPEETTEPSSEATEPSTSATEPSSEATEPSTSATEPSSEATEPSTSATEPSSEATEPSTSATEPSSEATEPSTSATEPSSEATEPSTSATEPSSEATEPSTGATEPSGRAMDPTTGATDAG